MTLTQLKYAITVAHARSMNEAARRLFISQPSLSSAIKELETEIGIDLFRRTNRGVSVTPEGEEFIGYARQVVEQYQLIESKYVEKENQKKKFSVSMQHYTFAVNAFVEMVRQFGMEEYEFAVHETKTYDVIHVRRDTREKYFVPLEGLSDYIAELLDTIHNDMYERARKNTEEKTFTATNFDEFVDTAKNHPGFIKAMWCVLSALSDGREIPA